MKNLTTQEDLKRNKEWQGDFLACFCEKLLLLPHFWTIGFKKKSKLDGFWLKKNSLELRSFLDGRFQPADSIRGFAEKEPTRIRLK